MLRIAYARAGADLGAVGVFRRVLNIDAGITRLARARVDSWWVAVLIGLASAAVMLLLRWALSGFYSGYTGFMILLPAMRPPASAATITAGSRIMKPVYPL